MVRSWVRILQFSICNFLLGELSSGKTSDERSSQRPRFDSWLPQYDFFLALNEAYQKKY